MRAYIERNQQIEQHLGKSALVPLVLCEQPRRSFVDILVCAAEKLPEAVERVRKLVFVDFRGDFRESAAYHAFEIFVVLADHSRPLRRTAQILISHGNGALYEVAQNVCKVGVVPVAHNLPRYVSVVGVRHFVQGAIAHSVHAEHRSEVVRI